MTAEIKTDTLLAILGKRILNTLVRPFRAGINCIFRETNIMSTAQEIIDGVADLKTVIESVDLKLDEVKAKIDALAAGSVVSQAQLDEIGAALSEAKSAASSVLSEAGELAVP